mmetsp:Transcript_65847/g.183458  ORF Transcript_65847/g.183458 Transcript_65847/m.183458 type:complete len:216 (-) Transcript_65847:1021-1668(-)
MPRFAMETDDAKRRVHGRHRAQVEVLVPKRCLRPQFQHGLSSVNCLGLWPHPPCGGVVELEARVHVDAFPLVRHPSAHKEMHVEAATSYWFRYAMSKARVGTAPDETVEVESEFEHFRSGDNGGVPCALAHGADCVPARDGRRVLERVRQQLGDEYPDEFPEVDTPHAVAAVTRVASTRTPLVAGLQGVPRDAETRHVQFRVPGLYEAPALIQRQ